MTQEDQTQNCSNSSSGGGIVGSSKKPKQKKVPQRGLGVAQLEKIRVEEQQKKDAAVASSAILPSPSSVSSSTKSSYMPLPIPNFHLSNQPSSSPISLPSGSPQNVDVKVSSSTPSQGNMPKFWNYHDYDFEKESFGVDPGLAFLPSLPYESNPIWPLPNWGQRTQHQQPPPPSMVNVSSGTSSTPALRYSMEPPSNQNYSGSCLPMQSEETMIGMKRPYPFSLDVPPAPSFNFRLPNFAASMKMNETTSSGSASGFNFDAGNSTLREVPSSSTSNSEPNSKRSNKENDNFNGDFLTLAPPTPTSCPPSNFKSPSTFLAFRNQEYPHLVSLSCQGIIEDKIPQLPVFSQFNQQQKQPFYSFLPPVAKAAQNGQTTSIIQNCNGEVGENVDLNLKL